MGPIFLGTGISSIGLLYHYDKIHPEQKKMVISSKKIFPKVDEKIIILISKNGMKRNLSSLGDLLLESFNYFESKFIKHNGVSKIKQYHLCPDSKFGRDKFLRRFNNLGEHLTIPHSHEMYSGNVLESYLVEPKFFINSLINSLKGEVCFVDDTVISILTDEKIKINTLSGQVYETGRLFIGNGPHTKFIPLNFLQSTKLERHKAIAGGVWQGIQDLGKDSFVITVGGANMIYLASKCLVQVSGKADPNAFFSGTEQDIFREHQHFSQIIPKLLRFDLGDLTYSLRDKGGKRMPYCQSLHSNGLKVTTSCGAYKNGYTTSLYLAKKELMSS